MSTIEENTPIQKNYIGISRDHSGSMMSIRKAAMRDYNETIQLLQETTTELGQDTIVSVVNCGYGRYARVNIDTENKPIHSIQKMSNYPADAGGTPLFDSVGELIRIFEESPDANNPNVSFLVMAVTDGEENASRTYTANMLNAKIKQLQATDRWTFVFRVPKGYKSKLVSYFGVPEGNVFEWDQTDRGVQEATQATKEAFTAYYGGLQSGVKSTTKFYTNLKDVDINEIKKSLVDVSSQIQIWHVDTAAEGNNIRDYCNNKLGGGWKKGAAFYLLVKPEREVQDYKKIIIRSKQTQQMYSGDNARDLLGLPKYGTCRVVPGDHGDYEIFIQSTSVNRKLPIGTTLAYWADFDK